MTAREVLEEFASFRLGVDTYEVHLFRRKDPRGIPLECEFDIEVPSALEAERARLERIRRARPVCIRRPTRADRRAVTRAPCAVCGAECPANTLGPVAKYCSDDCRKKACYIAKVESGKCLRASCLSDAEQGKTYCRPHLDQLAAKGREKRQSQKQGVASCGST